MAAKISACLIVLLGVTVASAYDGECPSPPYSGNLGQLLYDQAQEIIADIPIGFPDANIPPLDPYVAPASLPFNLDLGTVKLYGSINNATVTGLAKLYQCKAYADLSKGEFAVEERLDDVVATLGYDFTVELPKQNKKIPIKGSLRFEETNVFLTASGDFSLTAKEKLQNLVLDLGHDTVKIDLECEKGCGPVFDYVQKHISAFVDQFLRVFWKINKDDITKLLQDFINKNLPGLEEYELMALQIQETPVSRQRFLF